ncbi:phospholipase D-like domain-containing protein [Candidatus Nitrospira nitrificans]|uniref:phospholipase D n=1 Tax=Candidatus Nitrospira nitrificans TaxID=1742973 RepID=A0A0S4LJS5_9BACT|nr:phospholipase D-like domain-containing protein [Candidatus Nitrospira nitrificans]CUS37841.1 Phospholipase D domain-containing protein [Candidatus Nitrospira nitrificans]
MRIYAKSNNGEFEARIISGTRTILMAINCHEARRRGLRGFAFFRKGPDDEAGKYLRSQKVFESIVPNPKELVNGKPPVFRTDKHPVQSFLWSDYAATPSTNYTMRIMPMYGPIDSMGAPPNDMIEFAVKTEAEDDSNGHGIWFNRGAIASQHFAKEFGDIKPSPQQLDDLTQPVTRWLSRSLAEACLQFINETPPGEALRACLYEFTYKPILNAFKAAVDRGVDVQISYHKTSANDKAIQTAQLPRKAHKKQVLFPRTVPKIPHNKFIVRLSGNKPISVWTGSTNITPSGFLGQTNVGHKISDASTATTYFDYWKEISKDPDTSTSKSVVTRITPHPEEVPANNSITVVFSPRQRAAMLDWYANRILDAEQSVMFTAAFGVNEKLILPLAKDREFLRFVLMEKRPNKDMATRLRADKDVIISYGADLGQTTVYTNKKFKKQKIKNFSLDKWFWEEEHYRKSGNIFYVHTKFLLIDPLSDDPLVCTGSANFSNNSLTANDENMLIIRGDKRVADIYLTEFDRIFRHFYFRDVANEIEVRGHKATGAFLDETDEWTNSYFKPDAFKTRRREMFFAKPEPTWVTNAEKRPKDETKRDGDKPITRRKTN